MCVPFQVTSMFRQTKKKQHPRYRQYGGALLGKDHKNIIKLPKSCFAFLLAACAGSSKDVGDKPWGGPLSSALLPHCCTTPHLHLGKPHGKQADLETCLCTAYIPCKTQIMQCVILVIFPIDIEFP